MWQCCMHCESVGFIKCIFSGIGPIAFCDIVGTEEEDKDESLKGSKMNIDEARKAVSCRLSVHGCSLHFQENPSHALIVSQVELVEVIGTLTEVKAKMVVITPYRAQQKCIRSILEDRRLDGGCDVKTVKGSQGKLEVSMRANP